jgi:hypothetical protein
MSRYTRPIRKPHITTGDHPVIDIELEGAFR